MTVHSSPGTTRHIQGTTSSQKKTSTEQSLEKSIDILLNPIIAITYIYSSFWTSMSSRDNYRFIEFTELMRVQCIYISRAYFIFHWKFKKYKDALIKFDTIVNLIIMLYKSNGTSNWGRFIFLFIERYLEPGISQEFRVKYQIEVYWVIPFHLRAWVHVLGGQRSLQRRSHMLIIIYSRYTVLGYNAEA